MLADSDRLLASIEQILPTGRIGSTSHHRLNLSRIDLNGVVEECVSRALALHQISVDSLEYYPGSPATIMGDPDEVRAAISNLIDNAVKYSNSPVKVTVETSRLDGKYVLVRVKDRGAGIPKIELKQIFKRFYRVPGQLATRVKGTGLGLYIVRSVAKRHGGRGMGESERTGRGKNIRLFASNVTMRNSKPTANACIDDRQTANLPA